MAADKQPPLLPLEVRGHSAFAIAADRPGSTGASEQPERPVGSNGTMGPSVTNASTFVPDQAWQPPPRRSGYGYAGAFAAGAFNPDAFQTAEELGARADRTIAGAAVKALAGGERPDTVEATIYTALGGIRIANRDVILIKSTQVRLLVTAAIDQAKAERSNSAGVPELEAILAAVDNLHEMVLTTTALPPEVIDARVDTFKKGVLSWWAHDHVQILGNSFNGALFAALMELSAQVGLVQAVTIATILKGKDLVEALKALAKVLHGGD